MSDGWRKARGAAGGQRPWQVALRPDDSTADPFTAPLDEVVARDCTFLHAEMMADDSLWIGLSIGTKRVDLSVTVEDGRLVMRVSDADPELRYEQRRGDE